MEDRDFLNMLVKKKYDLDLEKLDDFTIGELQGVLESFKEKDSYWYELKEEYNLK